MVASVSPARTIWTCDGDWYRRSHPDYFRRHWCAGPLPGLASHRQLCRRFPLLKQIPWPLPLSSPQSPSRYHHQQWWCPCLPIARFWFKTVTPKEEDDLLMRENSVPTWRKPIADLISGPPPPLSSNKIFNLRGRNSIFHPTRFPSSFLL